MNERHIEMVIKTEVRHAQMLEPLRAVSQADHVRGAKDALITVMQYGHFECPRCKLASGASRLLLARYGDRVRFVFRHYLGADDPRALQAAEGAECAGAQGSFWEMHDLLMKRRSGIQRHHLVNYARKLHLDLNRFSLELEHRVYRDRVCDDQRSGAVSGVQITPTFFVDGRLVEVSCGLDALFRVVAETRP